MGIRIPHDTLEVILKVVEVLDRLEVLATLTGGARNAWQEFGVTDENGLSQGGRTDKLVEFGGSYR